MLNPLFLRYSPKIFWLILLDALLLPLAMVSAVLLRLGGIWDNALNQYWWIFVIPLLWVLPIFTKLGLYRAALKYIDDQIVWTVFYGVSLTVFILITVIEFAGITVFPRSAIIIFWVFAMAYIGGIRFLLRGLLRRMDGGNTSSIPVLLYGAGQAGLQLMSALHTSYEYQPVAFLDDNSALWGHTYRGLHIYNPQDIKSILRKTGACAILLAMPSVSRTRQKEIIEMLSVLHVPIKRLPSVSDIVSGHARIQELKEIEVDDLLGRDFIAPDPALLTANIMGKTVMVTGAGGSIGAELCRQILLSKPKKILLFELSEYALYQIDQQLARLAPDMPREAILGSVTDFEKLHWWLKNAQVETIYHTAAYKHVPIVESNLIMGVFNNAIGTNILVRAAKAASFVKTLVLISTDKAVQPVSVMGATKRLAELILQTQQSSSDALRLITVRFGNVLGSSGSVVPLFRQQIAQGDPITVTHPDVTRYFMTVTEAAQLVIQAGAMGKGGEIFVLDMGEPVRILDLAKRMIDLSGLTLRNQANPKGDIEIVFTGLRAGEKLHETLWDQNEILPTSHPRILHVKALKSTHQSFDQLLSLLVKACDQSNIKAALKYLSQLVKEFRYQEFKA
jgi:FlaA1/EpsC-like NDP-sugar epimerase